MEVDLGVSSYSLAGERLSLTRTDEKTLSTIIGSMEIRTTTLW